MVSAIKAIVIVWVIGMIALAIGGPLLTSNADVAAEALVEASGIDEQIAKVGEERCRQHQENYDNMWERSIESSNPEAMEDALRRAEIAMESYC